MKWGYVDSKVLDWLFINTSGKVVFQLKKPKFVVTRSDSDEMGVGDRVYGTIEKACDFHNSYAIVKEKAVRDFEFT